MNLKQQNVSLNNETFMIRPILIDLNPVEPNYYPLMVNLEKCNGSFNVADDLSTKMCSELNKRHKC